MKLERITVETRGHVVLIGLNRPAKRNAFDLAMYHELGMALGAYERDPRQRCAVLHAQGEHFTGGLELPQWLPFFRDGRMPPLPEGAVDPLHARDADGQAGRDRGAGLVPDDRHRAAARGRPARRRRLYALRPDRGQARHLPGRRRHACGWCRSWAGAMPCASCSPPRSSPPTMRCAGASCRRWCRTASRLDRALALAQTVARQSPVGVAPPLASARLARQAGERAAFARMLPDLQRALTQDDAVEGLEAYLERREPQFRDPE